MGEQTSIPVTRDARDELADTKPDGMSWSDYLVALRDESDQLKEIAMGGEPDLGELRSSVETIEARTGRIERQLDEVEGRLR